MAIILGDIRLLTKATELGGLAPAAQALGIPRASATRQLQRLEKELDCRLVHRTSRKFALTDEGRLLLSHCLRGLASIEEGIQAISKHDAPLSGILRIAAPYTYGRKVLGPRLPRFMAEHPMLSVSLALDSRHANLLVDEVDVAIRIGSLGSENLIAKRLGVEHFLVCASAAYLSNAPALNHPDDLRRHRFIDLRTSVSPREILFEGEKPARVKLTGVFSSNEPEVVLQAALQGLGVAILPESLITEQLRSSRLTLLLQDWKLPEWEVNALYAPGRGSSPKIRGFLEFLTRDLLATPPEIML
jgi:LysR family transcriptional regulator, regulator for bpeEF and oprC